MLITASSPLTEIGASSMLLSSVINCLTLHSYDRKIYNISWFVNIITIVRGTSAVWYLLLILCRYLYLINRPLSLYRWLSVGRGVTVELPYDYRSVAHTDTCFAPNILGRACFFFVWRPVWTASALDNWQIRYSAPKMEDAIIRSAHRRWRACVVRYDVSP